MIRTLIACALIAAPAIARADQLATAGNAVNVTAIAGAGGQGNVSGHLYGTPSVQGSYFAGANPCLVGAGVGGSGGPIGISINWGHDSEACERRQDTAALYTMGAATGNQALIQAAVNRMCDGAENRTALVAAGVACPGVRPQQVAQAAPPPSRARPDWCEHVGRGDPVREECK